MSRSPAALILVPAMLLCGCSRNSAGAPGAAPAELGSAEQLVNEEADVPEELSGEWYLLDFSGISEPQKWEFRSGGVLIAGDEEREWKLRNSLFRRSDKIYIDGERYEFTRLDEAIYIQVRRRFGVLPVYC